MGFLVMIPVVTEHAPFDLVAYDGRFYRIQVKYRTSVKGRVSIQFRTSWADKHGNHYKKMEKDLVDIICIYCPATDKCYYVDPKKFGSSTTVKT